MNKPNGISDKVWKDARKRAGILWNEMAKAHTSSREDDIDFLALAISKAIEETYEECAALLEEGYDKEVDEPYRDDGKPSKNDRCEHDRAMYEDCELCAAKAIRRLSKGQE